MPHDTEFDHEHEALSEADRLEMARYIWSQENVELRTIGIDIGSSTSHLLFAKVVLQRQTQGLSSRFLVVSREVVWRSPIMLTPFLPDGTIDAHGLGHFIHDAYHEAGFSRSDIDSGAVILTGEAIKRRNARAIDELFAHEAGKFVCATAGHKLECTLAAHGSGAVKLSKQRETCVLHVDIGGGTTKLALIDRGAILGVSAFAVGGRLLAEADGAWTRVDDSARLVAEELGLSTSPESLADPETRRRIAARLAEVAVDKIVGSPPDAMGRALQLTDELPRTVAPTLITFSGGVSEYVFSHEDREYGDIAKMLAASLTEKLAQRSKLPLVDPGQRIRATVIGASQFTVQVSGKTIHLPAPEVLPVHNVPVVRVELNGAETIPIDAVTDAIHAKLAQLDLNPGSRMAVAFSWTGDPEYTRLRDMAAAIRQAVAPQGTRDELLLLMIDGDVGRSIGHLLDDELQVEGKVVSIDGVQLQELDYVDVGEMITPPGRRSGGDQVLAVFVKARKDSQEEATMSEQQAPRYGVDSYLDWIKAEGLKVTEDYGVDLFTVETGDWPRYGVKGGAVHLKGRGDFCNMFVFDIPPGGSTAPQRHLYEDVVYVLEGRGSTQVEFSDGTKRSFEWGPKSLFAIPLNARHRFFNASGTERALLVSTTNMPLVMNTFHNEDFVFGLEFDFIDRAGKREYYSGEGDLITVRPGNHMWETNYVPDLAGIELKSWGDRGAGGTNIMFVLADGTMHAHISEMPVGTYKKGHRHGPSFHVMCVTGHGYSLLWYEGEKDFLRIDWKHGVVFPPADKQFHQHFNTSQHPARYLATAVGGLRYPMMLSQRRSLLGVKPGEKGAVSTSIKEGGDQIEYEDQDPRIHSIWLEEMKKNNVEPKMDKFFPNESRAA